MTTCISEYEVKPQPETRPETQPLLFPEIVIMHESQEITSGESFDIGTYKNSGELVITVFNIFNTGDTELLLLGDPSVILNGSPDFSLSEGPLEIIGAGESTSLIIQYMPVNHGINNLDIIIKNNDPDEGEYTFSVTAEKIPESMHSVTPGIKIFFTGPSRDNKMEDEIIKGIENQNSDVFLDLCIYGLNRERIIQSLEKAIENGVHLRFMGNKDGSSPLSEKNGDYYEAYFRIAQALDNSFPVENKKRINFPDDSGFDDFVLINDNTMHNKFVLFTDSTGDEYVFTGSANFTDSGVTLNNNNALLIRDSGIFNAYKNQFEYLLGLNGKEPVDSVQKYTIDGIDMELLFSPDTGVMNHLVDIIDTDISTSIYFMIFSFTHSALIDAFKRSHDRGIAVQGIFDKSQLVNSYEEALVRNGIPCSIDGNTSIVDGHGGKLHHKTMILDGSKVVTGSYNWSNSADLYNDENLLIITSEEIARIYEQEWQLRWDEAQEIVPDIEGNDTAEYQDIIINEVMWMGSRKDSGTAISEDEFIELKNMTDNDINLNGWIIEGAASSGKLLELNDCVIKGNDFLVIMKNQLSESAFIPGLESYTVNDELSLSNTCLRLVLKDYEYNTIDYAGNGSEGSEFSGYNDTLKKSMARNSSFGDGRLVENWSTSRIQVNISSVFEYLVYNCATPGADNSEGVLFYAYLDVVISEVAWAGTDDYECDGEMENGSNNEWIELYNNTDEDINLIGWRIAGKLDIDLSGIIPAQSHFLLERTNDCSIPTKTADLIYTGSLTNTGAEIILLYGDTTSDEVYMLDGWAAGSNDPKISMERINLNASGDSSNWRDGPGDIEGAQNRDD